MAVFAIPPLTVPAGAMTFGPFAVPAGLNQAVVRLDITNLTPVLVVAVDYSADNGTNWRNLGGATFGGPGTGLDRAGVPGPAGLGVTLGMAGSQPRVTSATAQVRVTVVNTTAFASTGGTLTVT